MNKYATCAGFIAIIGKPSVGKSTLLNRVLGKKISITSRKPQTTRHKILGIKTIGNFQSIYIDTPGLRTKSKNMLGSYMNKAALSVLSDADVVIFMTAGIYWDKEDEIVFKALAKVSCPIIWAINKVDLVLQKARLLKHIQEITKKIKFAAVIPISANDGTNISSLEQEVQALLPSNPFLFDCTQTTDKNDEFLVAEIIREKLMRFLGQELPYFLTVVIDKMILKNGVMHILGTIYIEKKGQKAIIIGKQGEMLKKIGTMSRKEIEKLLNKKIFLQLWVKVKSRWTDDKALLHRFGYL